jgi:tripartite-type tricarboxylate transporter receptor subunit TctC
MQAPRRQLITALPLVALSRASLAQGTSLFPSRPIRIVPFGTAGGPIDALARAYGERLEKRWGQPVLVDPKPGASGVIAADFVAEVGPGRSHGDDDALAHPREQRDPDAQAAL